jgi:hypothetical protein
VEIDTVKLKKELDSVREENIRLKKELEQYRKEVLINLLFSLKTLSRRMPSDMVKRSHRKVIDHIESYIF